MRSKSSCTLRFRSAQVRSAYACPAFLLVQRVGPSKTTCGYRVIEPYGRPLPPRNNCSRASFAPLPCCLCWFCRRGSARLLPVLVSWSREPVDYVRPKSPMSTQQPQNSVYSALSPSRRRPLAIRYDESALSGPCVLRSVRLDRLGQFLSLTNYLE